MITKKQKIEDTLYYYDLLKTDKNCLNNIMGAMIEIQKYNFWRGFRACLTVLATIILLTLFISGGIISRKIDRDMREWEQQQIEIVDIINLNK